MIEFDDFWQAYPRKQDKKKAKSKWERLSLRKRETIMDDLKTRYIGTESQFIPMPTTYMNGERWEDEQIKVSDYGTHQQDNSAVGRVKRANGITDEPTLKDIN